MTAADDLRPARRADGLTVREVPADDAPRLARSLYRQIWAPLGGGGRGGWREADWREELGRPGIRLLVAEVDGRAIGFAQMGWPGDGQAGFVVLGVLPSEQGRGYGGDLLSRLTRMAWDTPAPAGAVTRRVWLWTLEGEHPATVPNYLARGFWRVTRTPRVGE